MTRAQTFIQSARMIEGQQSSRHSSDDEIRSFKAQYGIRPEICLVLFRRLRIVNCRPQIKHLLWALAFLKTYSTEDVLAAKVGTTRKTFRKRVWEIVPKIAQLATHVVSGELISLLVSRDG